MADAIREPGQHRAAHVAVRAVHRRRHSAAVAVLDERRRRAACAARAWELGVHAEAPVVSPRITAALAVALALVIGYIFVVDRPQAKRAEEAKRLIQVAPKDVTRIAISSAKGAVELARRDATRWDVINPIRVPAGSYAVSSLLDTVTGLVPQQSLGT